MALFRKIFVEREVESLPYTTHILKKMNRQDYILIDDVNDLFGRVKKPYLQKRTSLDLFIGKKRGDLVKQAPNAYGVSGEDHFYFVHAYNCIYECEYCYLQGYFNSPDIVLFVNHDEIIEEMTRITESYKGKPVWFHAGEFSDSLALNQMTNEYEAYWDFFEKHPNAFLEIRTKSANIKSILNYKPLPNVVISFSMSPENHTKKYEHKTAPLKTRLKAIKTLNDLGFRIGLHLDPIIHHEDFEATYFELIKDIKAHTTISNVAYISIGVVRFTKDVFYEVTQNYPKSDLLAAEFVKSFDNKIRYNRPTRLYILNRVESLLIQSGFAEEQVYKCMED